MSQDTHPCVACGTETDTSVAYEGGLEWLVAFLCAIDIPMAEAEATVREGLRTYGVTLPTRMTFCVCQPCGSKAHSIVSSGEKINVYQEPPTVDPWMLPNVKFVIDGQHRLTGWG